MSQQPPWDYPPAYVQPHVQHTQYPRQFTPQPPFAPRKRRRGLRILAWSSVALLVIVVLAVIFGGGGSPSGTAAPSTHAVRSTAPNANAAKADACGKRPAASGDIYVRMLSPGVPWTAQQLGGEWVWNTTLRKCLTSVQMTIATAPTVAGSCTQVGYVKDNPGYDVNADRAPRLKKIAAEKGPAC